MAETQQAAPYVGDWDARGTDLDQRYARFDRVPLTDDEVWWLSMARKVMVPASIGDKLFLTSRSDCRCFRVEIQAWGEMVAEGIAKAKFRHPRHGQRRRTLCEGYRVAWGKAAAADGLELAMFGPSRVPGLVERGREFGVRPASYQAIRDFVGGAAVMAIEEYKFALLWAMGRVRDRVFDARYEEFST